MRFKTTPMGHQLRGFDLLKGKTAFALLMEQGTGKTKVIIDDAARCWGDGEIDALLVIAPNGVHTKWVTIEIPKHMPEWCPVVAAYYSAGASKKHQATIEKLFERTPDGEARPLRVLTMNVEALATTEGVKLLDRFTQTFNAMGVLDESQRFKNPKAVRTDVMIKRRRRFPKRRIMSGTPVTKAPFDIFSQFYFLDPTILRTDSYTAFKTEYAEMLDKDHYLVKKLQRGAWQKKDGTPSKRVPQIIARDSEGLPVYRNLDKLQRLIAKHSYRVLKKDCLDLPDKVYDVVPFDMTPRQAEIYHRMERERRAELIRVIDGLESAARKHNVSLDEALMAGRELIVANKLVALAKLQQITCGYLKLEDGEVVRMFKKVMDNPRNVAMMSLVEDTEGQILFWAPHRDKVDQIVECLREGFDDAKIVRYDGAVKKADRMQGVDDFQEGKARFFVGNPASAATGLTLTAGETAFYYSDSFNYEHRAQSEDRNHRIGTTSARYFDLAAIGTIDETIAKSHAAKKSIADYITGDANL
jgi:SNF2 family DNA or RNA helicase